MVNVILSYLIKSIQYISLAVLTPYKHTMVSLLHFVLSGFGDEAGHEALNPLHTGQGGTADN